MVVYLDTIRTTVNNAQTELLQRGLAVTAERLKEYVRSGGIRTYTVGDLVNEFLADLRERTEGETYKKYVVVYNRFLEFIGKETELNMVTNATMTRFYNVLKAENVESTSGGKMTKMKTLFRWAFESGKMNVYPMNSIKITKGQPKKEYLTRKEISLIKDLHTNIERLEKVRDLFVFQLSTGLSYVDIAGVKELLVNGDTYYIKGRRQKTGIEFTAVVLKDGVEIWNKYDGVLPLLSNQKYNSYLQEIQDLTGICKKITTHLARKTYATLMLNAGIALSTVSKMLGHSNTKITERHYSTLLDDTIFSEIRKVAI